MQMNRYANAGFRQGLPEEVHLACPPASFDLVYSFAVLKHVRDADPRLRRSLPRLHWAGTLAD